MSLPQSAIALLAFGLSFAPGPSVAPGTLRGVDPDRARAAAAIDTAELAEIAARIEAVTELRSALGSREVAASPDLAGPLEEALGELYDPAGHGIEEVSLDRVRSLVRATRSLTEAELAAARARTELRRAIANL